MRIAVLAQPKTIVGRFQFRHLVKLAVLTALIVATLFGMESSGLHLRADGVGGATDTVVAGMETDYLFDVLAFAPQTIRVHRGDTVTWEFGGLNDVRFARTPLTCSSHRISTGNPYLS
jgi:plastocyanin